MQTETICNEKFRPLSKGEKQIFIVDDDESICRALKTLMATYGFAVRTFLSAEEFFSAIPNNVSGCLILDILLPGLEGFEAQERLLKSGSNRPVIMMTGNKNNGFRERALKSGVAGFLQKPFHDQELILLINQAMQMNRKMNQFDEDLKRGERRVTVGSMSFS